MLIMETYMNYHFKPSKDELVSKTVLLAVAGTTGSGKTESAMRIARGIVGDNGKFCVIDTESRRALNKKSRYQFDHMDLKAQIARANFKAPVAVAAHMPYH